MSVVVFIPLTRGKVTVIDFEDFEKVRGLNWHALKVDRRWYAARTIKRIGKSKKVLLHREILNPNPFQTDHIDGDGLNNVRLNLRQSTHQENGRAFQRKKEGASSRFRGVSWIGGKKKWLAQTRNEGKRIYLGYHTTEKEAALAHDEYVIKHFGEFASPNFKP